MNLCSRYLILNKSNKQIAVIGCMSLLFMNVSALLWYVFFGYQSYFHSDSATKVLLAREIYDTGSFFPKDWIYGNGDLFVIFGHIFIVPLLAFMPAGFMAHAISSVIFSGMILYGIWLISDISSIDTWRRIVVIAVFATGISSNMVENLYGQVSYGIAVFFCIYIIFFAVKYLNTYGKQQLIWAALLVVFILFAYWGNPKRAAVIYGLPFIGALVWMALAASRIHQRRSLLILITLSVAGAVIGSILHAVTIVELNNSLGAANARWLSFDLLLRNVTLSLKGILSLMGGMPLANEPLFTGAGLYAGIRFIVAIMVIVMIPIAIKRSVLGSNDELKILALFAAFSMTISLFFQITTSIPDMNDPLSSARYLVPSMTLCLIVLLIAPIEWSRPPLWMISIAVITVILASSSYYSYGLSALQSRQIFCGIDLMDSAKRDLIKLFAKHDLRYGYAFYWNAGALSVLSNETVKIRQILAGEGGLPVPFRWLGSNAWYRPAAYNGKTFLMLHNQEISQFDWKKMADLGLIPIEKYSSHGFTIFVFPENIARYLPGWDTILDKRYQESKTFTPIKGALSIIGHRTKTEDGLADILIAEKGESGALHYGPYVDVEPGRYRVTFDVYSDHNSSGVVKLDVAASPGQKIYGEKLLTESNGSQYIEFMLDKSRTLEFRVWALGTERVTFRGVTIQRIGD